MFLWNPTYHFEIYSFPFVVFYLFYSKFPGSLSNNEGELSKASAFW